MSGRGWTAVALLTGAGALAIMLLGRSGAPAPEPSTGASEAAPPSPVAGPARASEAARSLERAAGESARGEAGVGVERQAGEELRCRCAPLDLAAYWAMADEVAIARLATFDETEGGRVRVFRMVLETPPWKTGRPSGAGAVAAGDTVEYRTAVSTATCGVQPELGAVYAVFGRHSGDDSTLVLDTCSGTRVHRGADGLVEEGAFQDVPGRFLVRRFDALGGLEALQGVPPMPDPTDPAADVLRGLLDLEPLAHGGVVRVFERPDRSSAILATLDDLDQVVKREVGYEVTAAVVFGRLEGWSRIRLTDGRSGWIAPDEAGTWFPYANLPIRRLAYLTPIWSGYVWPGPGAGIPARVGWVGEGEEEQPVEVLESRVIGGHVWFRISIPGGSPCDGAGEAPPVAGGWVPGYGTGPDGASIQPAIWYWSRGC